VNAVSKNDISLPEERDYAEEDVAPWPNCNFPLNCMRNCALIIAYFNLVTYFLLISYSPRACAVSRVRVGVRACTVYKRARETARSLPLSSSSDLLRVNWLS